VQVVLVRTIDKESLCNSDQLFMATFTTSSRESIYFRIVLFHLEKECEATLGGGMMAARAQVGDLELGLLRMFLAVAENGSIGKAAAAVDMTQPAVSQQMLRLEKIIGQKLFARGRNGVTLTRPGELLIEYANRAVDLNDETLQRFREPSVAQVVIGASADIAFAGLIPGLARLQTIRPEVEVKIVVTTPDKLVARLKANEMELAIADPKAITAKPVAVWQVPLYWSAKKQLHLEGSRPLPLLLFDTPNDWQKTMLDSVRSAGWDWRVIFASPSLDAVLSATQSGLGVSALPRETIRKARLACLCDSGLPPAPLLEFGVFSAAALSNSARTVLELATAAISQLKEEC
jgi:DNA-binding transcriptional LysR family regulator